MEELIRYLKHGVYLRSICCQNYLLGEEDNI